MHCRRLSLNVGYCRIKRLLPENVISTKQSAWRNPLNIEVCFLFGGPVAGRQLFCRCAAFPLSGESPRLRSEWHGNFWLNATAPLHKTKNVHIKLTALPFMYYFRFLLYHNRHLISTAFLFSSDTNLPQSIKIRLIRRWIYVKANQNSKFG